MPRAFRRVKQSMQIADRQTLTAIALRVSFDGVANPTQLLAARGKRRREGGLATDAARLRRAATARRVLPAARAAGADAAGDGARARSLRPPDRREGAQLAEPHALPRHRRALDAADSGAARARAQGVPQARRRSRAHHARRTVAARAVCRATPTRSISSRSTPRSTRLAALNERQAKVVELRYFGGLSVEETAEALDISPATVKRDWTLARAWLQARAGRWSDERPLGPRRRALRCGRSCCHRRARAHSSTRRQTPAKTSSTKSLSLLAAHDAAGDFLETPPTAACAGPAPTARSRRRAADVA